jgi:hypothetical protein
VGKREKKRGDLKHLSVHQWVRSAIRESQQPTLLLGFLFLKLPPPPCAVLLVYLKFAFVFLVYGIGNVLHPFRFFCINKLHESLSVLETRMILRVSNAI